MGIYLARRLGVVVAIGFVASIITFIAIRLTGNPVYMLLPTSASPSDVAMMEHRLGLDRPLVSQYFSFLAGLFRGDFGWSFRSQESVASLIGQAVPTTLYLIALSIVPAAVIGIFLGVMTAYRSGGYLDKIMEVVNAAGLAMPSYWTGLLLIQFVALPTGWFPVRGNDSIVSYVLPAASLVFMLLPPIVRITKSGVLDVSSQLYVLAARARGLSERRVQLRYVLRTSLGPVVAIIGLEFGNLIGGAIITETVFSLPGVGRLIVSAIEGRDFPVVQSTIVIFAVLFGIANLLVDVIAVLIDPRAKEYVS